jgi:hypothetical protein
MGTSFAVRPFGQLSRAQSPGINRSAAARETVTRAFSNLGSLSMLLTALSACDRGSAKGQP